MSVKDLTHLKKQKKQRKNKSNTGFNLNKERGEAGGGSKQEQPKTIPSSTESNFSYDNYHVPKLSKLREEEEGKISNKKPSIIQSKVAHIIFKKKKNPEAEHHSDYLPLEPGHMYTASVNKAGSAELQESFPSNYSLVRPRTDSSHDTTTTTNYSNSTSPVHRRSKRQSPDTVWPEVLLVVDYDSYLLHGGNSRDVKRYFISFWNGVDLRYKLLTHPRIRVSLAGMIVAKVSCCYT